MLPLEVLAGIFEFTDDFDDLKAWTLVCKHWLRATQIAKILKNYRLCFSFVTIDAAIKEPLSLFYNSNRAFSNIYFENTKFKYIDPKFWSRWSETITEITFNYKFSTPDLPGGSFVELLKYTPKLRTLNLICVLHSFNMYLDALPTECRRMVLENIKNVQYLQMYFCGSCVETIEFKPWIDHMTNLKNIDLDVHSKKSPISKTAYDQIFNFLRSNGSKVKGLHICDNNKAINRSVIERLLEIDNMKLKAFDMIANNASKKVFTDFLLTQSDLQYLTVSGSFSLSTVLPKMLKLKEIVISNGPPLNGFEVFNNIKKLESLGIAGLEFYDEDALRDNYNLQRNPKLKDLYLIDASIDFNHTLTIRLCECFENIRLLNIDGAMIDDSCLYYIFKLKNLQELKLSNTQITDDGILGNFESLVHKKKKKPNVETNKHSIAQLTKLEVLNIDYCKRLTMRSFQSFHFKKLKHLSAQGCSVQNAGLRSLGKNCPNLESLNFSKCNQLREADINIISSHIKGLETLELMSCSRIDERCMQHITANCKKLQTLDVSNCTFDIKAIANQMFQRINPLRRILLHKERLYRCNYVT